MEVTNQTKLKFLGVDFPIVNLYSEKPLTESKQIELNVNPSVFYPKDSPNDFKIIQDIKISVEGYFNIEIRAIGHFQLQKVTEKEKETLINVNASAIMFPYIRAFIATLTSNLGNVTGTLNIPPQFFKGDVKEISE